MKKLLSFLLAGTMVISTASMISTSAAAEEHLAVAETTAANRSGEFTSEDGTYKYRVVDTKQEGTFAIFEKLLKSDKSTFTIPDSLGGAKVISVGESAFEGLNKLKSVTLGKYVNSIGAKAFKGCTSLSKINIDNICWFGAKSFSGCHSLKSINFTKGYDKEYINIAKEAFYNCKNLKTVKIYDEAIIGAKAFGFLKSNDKVKDFKMILSTSDKFGDNDYTKDGIAYCYNNKIKCIYNLNSSDTKKLYMWAGFSGEFTVDTKKLTNWTSSNNKVLTIDSQGNFIVLKKGKVKITAKMANGKKYSKTVSVKNDPTLSTNKITVNKGSVCSLKITGKANSINNKYSISNVAKIISSKSARTIKVKGIRKGITTFKIVVNGVKTLKLTLKVV